MSTNRGVDKEDVVHTYGGVLLSHTKEEIMSSTATLMNLAEKALAPHSSTLAWKTPWTEEPDGLQSMGLLRVGHD